MAKKALSVRINKYANPGSDLRGCVNDSLMIREMLKKHFGFNRSDITLLLDHQATQSNMIAALKDLVDGAKPGDVLVFHYSGHGSNVVDYNNDENDGYDEIICPHDLDWNNPFTDDMLSDLLKVEDGVNLTMIMDCCNSGTINREFMRPGEFSPVKARFLMPPTALIANQHERERLIKRTIESQKHNNSMLISGCRDDQTSADAWIDGEFHGAFTFYLNECLKLNNWTLNMSTLHEGVTKALTYHNYTQRPVLSGPDGVKEQVFLETI